jgi:hypothetical protein
MTPVDLCNQALVEIGYPRVIGDFWEGSPAAQVAIQVYGQTRDDLLREADWQWARGDATLTILKQALIPPLTPWDETQPVPPWQFEYAYPSDCLYLRYLRPEPDAFFGWDQFEPVPILFTLGNDLISGVQTKVILTNLGTPGPTPTAIAVYTRQVLDPNLWEANFRATLIERLATKFTVGLSRIANQGALEILKGKGQEAAVSEQMADRRRED